MLFRWVLSDHEIEGAQSMPTILPFDDLNPRAFVTIHSIHEEVSGTEDDAHRVIRSMHRGKPDFSSGHRSVPGLGVPLQILALNAPFVMVLELATGGRACGPIYLDSRRIRLMSVPDEMIEVLRGLGLHPVPELGVEEALGEEEEIPF